MVKLIFRPEARALESIRGIGARDALGEPKCAGVLLLGVVDRLERLRTHALHVPGMEELVRGDRGRLFYGGARMGGRARVFHASATDLRIPADVEEKRIFLERRTAHQLQFVRGEEAETILEAVSFPILAVDSDPEVRTLIIECESVKSPDLGRGVNQGVVACCDERVVRLGRGHELGEDLPSRRHAVETDQSFFVTATGHIHQYLGEINESMMLIQLRVEWAGFVPLDAVINFNLTVLLPSRGPHDLPGLLVEFADRHLAPVLGNQESMDVMHSIREVANLIESVPRRESHEDILLRGWHNHLDSKQMLVWMIEVKDIGDVRLSGAGAAQE